VTCLEFHPREPFLASGSSDFTIKIFDYSKASGTLPTVYPNMLYRAVLRIRDPVLFDPLIRVGKNLDPDPG
jgi:hypothetical protein